jgi:hypothetical protein
MAVKTLGLIVRIDNTEVGRLESFGDIKFSRGTKEYNALNRDEVLISVGSVQSADFPVKVLMDQQDTGAQKILRDAVRNASTVTFEIELPDKLTDTGNGTKFTWNNAVVYEEVLSPEEDGFILATFNLKVPGFPTVTAAS